MTMLQSRQTVPTRGAAVQSPCPSVRALARGGLSARACAPAALRRAGASARASVDRPPGGTGAFARPRNGGRPTPSRRPRANRPALAGPRRACARPRRGTSPNPCRCPRTIGQTPTGPRATARATPPTPSPDPGRAAFDPAAGLAREHRCTRADATGCPSEGRKGAPQGIAPLAHPHVRRTWPPKRTRGLPQPPNRNQLPNRASPAPAPAPGATCAPVRLRRAATAPPPPLRPPHRHAPGAAL